MTRTKMLRVRMSDAEWAKMERIASGHGQTLSDYARMRLLGEMDDVAELREALDNFTEFFGARRRAEPPIPQPDTTPSDWDGDPNYRYPGKHD